MSDYKERCSIMGLHSRVLVLAVVFCAWTSLASAQQPLVQKDQLRVAEFHNIDLSRILAQIAADYSVTIGFEADQNKPQSPIEVSLRDVNFLQFMDGVVKADRRYQWGE